MHNEFGENKKGDKSIQVEGRKIDIVDVASVPPSMCIEYKLQRFHVYNARASPNGFY